MEVYFTICSNNYLANAKILGESLKKHTPAAVFFIFLCDEKRLDIDYSILADETIPVAAIEPRIQELASKYNIVELNTALKPTAFEYLFTIKQFKKAIYLDPDIKVFASLSFLFTAMDRAAIILTPHIYTPIPFDGKTPSENTFLNFGLYNLGFIGLRYDSVTAKFLAWWKEHTYRQGYIDVYKGIFVDQLPVNLVPIFFSDVEILFDRGLNMAPWNLHERILSEIGGNYLVNNHEPLKFYHFSSFDFRHLRLPSQHYNRYTLEERPDLLTLYQGYQKDLAAAGYAEFSTIETSYTVKKQQKTSRLKKLFGNRNLW